MPANRGENAAWSTTQWTPPSPGGTVLHAECPASATRPDMRIVGTHWVECESKSDDMSFETFASLFESGVSRYFQEFGHRQAREIPHQAWLLISVSNVIDPQLLVAELTLPRMDLLPFADIGASKGAVNFDFAVSRSQIDLRTWRTRTPDWKSGASTHAQTLETLREVVVLAEFKVAESSYAKPHTLARDLEKLRGVIGFMHHHGCSYFPSCYLIVLDQDRTLDTQKAIKSVAPNWPSFTPFPKVLVGP